MSFGFRIRILDEQDRVVRLSVKKFNRLCNGDSTEMCPEYAGKRMRAALITVENENGKPVSIHSAVYEIFAFDEDGRLDSDLLEKKTLLSFQCCTDIFSKEGPTGETVVDASAKFARRRMRNEFEWEPTAEQNDAIAESIFGTMKRME